MHYDGDGYATAIKPSAGYSWKSYRNKVYRVNLHTDAGDEGIVDSGCSRSMTGNKERLDDFQPFKGGKVTFGGGEGRIIGKGTIRTPKLDFENVYYVKELQQFNLFSVSQICDKKNRVLYTDTDCLVISNNFKLQDESMVLLRVPRKHNLYTFNLNNLAPKENLTILLPKDRKSTTGGCQFLGRRLILWQCKKQTIVVTSSTEAEYVAAANCCGQAFDGPSLSVPSSVPRVPTGSFIFPTGWPLPTSNVNFPSG
ncbi:putative ribonuclease H-like domain-containing protein [Tanacetum coccineum]